MKLFFRLSGFWLLLACVQLVSAQSAGPKVDRVDIKYIGPTNVNEQFIQSNIRLKAGDTYRPSATEEDVHALYDTGQFFNIHVSVDPADSGNVVVTYIVQTRPRITDVKIIGNTNVSEKKIRKKIAVKAGGPLDEQKLFTDTQEIKKLYENEGYPGTEVKYIFDTMDEAGGKASVTFQIREARRIRITRVDFIGASAFPQKQLRKQIKTRKHRFFLSWFSNSGVFREDQFEDDKEALADFYHNHGYLDFEIKNVQTNFPTLKTMTIRFEIFEGRQYKVGTVSFVGANKVFDDQAIRAGLKASHDFQRSKAKLGTNNLPMDVGNTFTPDGQDKDVQLIEDFYGSKGYIDVRRGSSLRANRIPNVDTGKIDLEFQIDAGQKNYVERINIHGNIKTRDKVIRRELAISPGEVFDTVRVKVSKERLEGLNYFSKVVAEPVSTDPPIPGRKDLDVSVEEQETGKLTLGAGFSSVDSLVAFGEVTQGNFDLFHPPTFTGGGQKLRLMVQFGAKRQDYELGFIEPWFLNRKLSLSVDFYRHQLNFESPNSIYDESRTGARIGLTRALGSDNLIGGINYSIEQVGIRLTSGTNAIPMAITNEAGDHIFNRFGAVLAYDTRNSVRLPNHGQRSEILPEIDLGTRDFYKIIAKTAWYFPGLLPGNVLEVGGRAGIAKAFHGGGDVPFYDRYYLGGLYDLRGFGYRNISPRDPSYVKGVSQGPLSEPIGGDSYWFASAEYSVPIFEKDNGPSLRLAAFFDAGTVGAGTYTFGGNFNDNWGFGLRLDIPHLGPLRIDYGIPIHHDQFNGSSPQFQFDVGYTRPF
jgi:outer membrane protein insertion porin family